MAKQAAVNDDPFLNATPSQANITEATIKYPTLQWLGSKNNELTGWFIGQQFVETVDELSFYEPPQGVSVATATLGGNGVEGWAPTNGVFTLHTIRSAFRWEVYNEGERRTRLFYGWKEADEYAAQVNMQQRHTQKYPARAKSRFMALVMIREIGPHPFFLTSHGDVTREMRALIGWGGQPKYRSVIQNMALAATQYARQNGRAITYGQEVFALPIGPDKERKAGSGNASSRVVPPTVPGLDVDREITVQIAGKYFPKDDADLWGMDGLFERWLKDEEEGGVMAEWKRKIEPQDDASEEEAQGEVAEEEVPGMEPNNFGPGDFAPPPAASKFAAPPPGQVGTPSRAPVQEQILVARKTFLLSARDEGADGKDAATGDYHRVYDGMRMAGYPADGDLMRQMFHDFFGPQAAAPTQLQLRTLDHFLRSNEENHKALRAQMWPQ